MDPMTKFIIRDQLKEKFPALTDELLYNLISELDKMKVLHSFREPKQESLNPSPINSSLPRTFKMISPLWSGYVRLIY